MIAGRLCSVLLERHPRCCWSMKESEYYHGEGKTVSGVGSVGVRKGVLNREDGGELRSEGDPDCMITTGTAGFAFAFSFSAFLFLFALSAWRRQRSGPLLLGPMVPLGSHWRPKSSD